jgi:hypothetical protein
MVSLLALKQAQREVFLGQIYYPCVLGELTNQATWTTPVEEEKERSEESFRRQPGEERSD